MKITVREKEQDFFNLAAWRIAAEIEKTPRGIFGFSTGRTTKGIHASLAELYRNYHFDTSNITVFGLDEITNVSRDFPGSCYYILLNEVVKPLDIPMKNYLMPPVYSDDFEKVCVEYQAQIENRGSIDLQILGIGENGHIGFNQPGTSFGSNAWLSKMDDELDKRIRRESGSVADAILGGLTLGIRNIMNSRKIILTANGPRKAEIISKALFGPVTEGLPASVLQLHPDCEVILDGEAARFCSL